MAPALVVFDMAGTTVEDPGVVNRRFRDALAAAGLEVEPAAVDAVMGLPKPEAFRRLIEHSVLSDALTGPIEAIDADLVGRESGRRAGRLGGRSPRELRLGDRRHPGDARSPATRRASPLAPGRRARRAPRDARSG
jgi:hypothetical protein